ncbi:hypothetical protein PsorP6_003125 [Peronosclerospora sorghi]|uniref:Uncharacterized protein n=1 Tax=Peronosclerospora sorghi TaxID=230839 RepID=A0ACC0VQT5_9STRA|nr:hypothetical protein PsorP6_003125 [Peronosclerospora sorghi]
MQSNVLRDGACGYVLGPPGSGKSPTAVTFALTLARTEWVVTWISLKSDIAPVCVRLEKGRELHLILDGVDDTKKHILFLDGFTLNKFGEKILCREWLKKNRTNRRLVVLKHDEDKEIKVYEHLVSSWTLEEYLTAPQGCIGRPWTGAVTTIGDRQDIASAGNYTTLFRQCLYRSKHYFAGGCSRFIFGYSIAEVVAPLEKAIRTLSNVASAATCTVGDDSPNVFYRLYGSQENSPDYVISRYAAAAIAMFEGPLLIKRLASVHDYTFWQIFLDINFS